MLLHFIFLFSISGVLRNMLYIPNIDARRVIPATHWPISLNMGCVKYHNARINQAASKPKRRYFPYCIYPLVNSCSSVVSMMSLFFNNTSIAGAKNKTATSAIYCFVSIISWVFVWFASILFYICRDKIFFIRRCCNFYSDMMTSSKNQSLSNTSRY